MQSLTPQGSPPAPDWEQQRLHWINREIPAYLSKHAGKTFEEFLRVLASVSASQEWKALAVMAAKERWGVLVVPRIPR